MTRLFKMVAKPLASPQTPGAFLCGLRIMAVDGSVFDIPDTETNEARFWLYLSQYQYQIYEVPIKNGATRCAQIKNYEFKIQNDKKEVEYTSTACSFKSIE